MTKKERYISNTDYELLKKLYEKNHYLHRGAN